MKISMVHHRMSPRYGVSFHIGDDPDNRRPVEPLQPSDLSDKWGWYQCVATGAVVLALRAEDDMHVLGAELRDGSGARIDLEAGDWLAIDFIRCTVRAVTDDEMASEFLVLTP